MAKLTPLAKGLITVIILGATGAAAWRLGLRDVVTGLGTSSSSSGKTSDGGSSSKDGGGTQPSKDATGSEPGPGPTTATGSLGSAGNPLKVSIVSFHGYAPGLLANGKSLKTASGSIYAGKNVNVEFVIQDDIPTLATIFESKAAHCAWRTSDFWAQEQPNLRNNKLDGRAIMIVDNTQGADAVISRDPAVGSIEDLAGKSIALLQYTPSHGMVIDAVDNSSLSARKQQTVQYVFINADEGTAGVRAAFEGGQVQAAALWDPDLSLALRAVSGARVIYSTKTATNLIYDVVVCDQRVLDVPANENMFTNFVSGWFEGVEAARANQEAAIDALVATEEFFQLLAQQEGRPFIQSLFGNLVWTGLEDNVRILGLAGQTNHYERVYRRFDEIYRSVGALANPNSPVINPPDSFDYRFVKSLSAAKPEVKVEAEKPQFTFTPKEREVVVAKQEASVTKPVLVSFQTGSAALNKRAERTIDDEMVPLIENNGSAYFEVSGNTDATGSRPANLKLSLERATAVVDYLVREWEFDRARFQVVGHGPDKPLCNEAKPQDEGMDLEACRSANRTTRVAVLSRE